MKTRGQPQTTLREGFEQRGIYAVIVRVTDQPEPIVFREKQPWSDKFQIIEERLERHEDGYDQTEIENTPRTHTGFPIRVRIARLQRG